MANVAETTTYDAGVYQLETTDPVQGGASGVSNNQAKNLANRTNYLKSQTDALNTAVTGLAPIANPVFTGDPRAPTPPANDNDTSIPTTAWVQTALSGILSKSVAGGSNVTLTATEASNGVLSFTGALTGNIDVIVPSTAKGWIVQNATSGAFTLRLKTAAGLGVYVTQGKQIELWCNATDVAQSTNDFVDTVFTGDPKVPTAASGDNDTSIASTAFVNNATDGTASVNVAGGSNVTLTAAQAGSAIINLTGAITANINVIFPASSGQWIISNNTSGAFTIVAKTASGAGVSLPSVGGLLVYGDGTNILPASSAGTGTTGAVEHFASTSAPAGFVKANGSLLSRVTYAALWAYAQTTGNVAASDGAWTKGQWSPGDGSTTFRVPDFRGYHVRSFDDGAGVDSGRTIGSIQNDQLQVHAHSYTDPGHYHSTYIVGGGGGAIQSGPPGTQFDNVYGGNTTTSTTGITINNSSGGSETRVKTIALLACIKY